MSTAISSVEAGITKSGFTVDGGLVITISGATSVSTTSTVDAGVVGSAVQLARTFLKAPFSTPKADLY